MNFWRIRCSKCGKTFGPLAKFIGLERCQTKVMSLKSDGSKRSAAIIPAEPSTTTWNVTANSRYRFHTAHGWIMRSEPQLLYPLPDQGKYSSEGGKNHFFYKKGLVNPDFSV